MRIAGADEVKRLREQYPVGSRVELLEMDDARAPPSGTKRTVKGVEDIGSSMVAGDDGCGLSVAFGVDACRKVVE